MNRLFFIFLLFNIINGFSQNTNFNKNYDSIKTLIDHSRNRNYDYDTRLFYASKAVIISKEVQIDSLLLLATRNISQAYLNLGDLESYKSINHHNLKLAIKLKDSLSLAYANHNLGYYHHEKLKHDSAYFYYLNASKFYNSLNKTQNVVEVLQNISDIQDTERDFIGCEVTAVKAIKILESLPKTEHNLDLLWSLHNLIGLSSMELQSYNKAIDYHEKAMEFSSKMKDFYLNEILSINNIALVHRKEGQFNKALPYYERVLENKNLFKEYPNTYLLYLNNLAYTKFKLKNDRDEEVLKLFNEAYRLSDSLNDQIRKQYVSLNLSEYYNYNNEKDLALKFSKEAYLLSKQTKSFEVVLKSLILLAKIDDNGEPYLTEYIKLNDSLLQNERSIRNKFARIEFETDQIKAENEQISKERLIFLISSVGLLVTLILLYVIISQRNKNKALRFSKMQQEANEEIYNLMLAQQDKVDEGRTQEKKRISEELHDGILGRLFGTRLSLDSLNFVNTDDAIKTRSQYIDELKSIEQEIRKISHDLNTDFVSGSSFSDIIQSYVETQTLAYQLEYDYHEDDNIDWDELSNKTKIHVYRMLQETMQNIYKHANAKHIKISFQLKNNVILLTVEDDGSGFNTNKARKGIGLKNFDSRASEIGGKVEIFSTLGEGTKVVIHVPTE